jgi:Ca2+-binding RTX toxin-like protein
MQSLLGREFISCVAVLTSACEIENRAAPPEHRRLLDAPFALAQPCTYGNHTVAIVLSANETVTIAGADGGALMINSQPCGAATLANTRRLTVGTAQSADFTDETVIIDLSSGVIAPGSASGGGISVTLGSGNADTVRLVGGSNADVFVVGATASEHFVVVNQDLFRDISLFGVESIALVGNAGADTLSGAGAHPSWPLSSHFNATAALVRITLEGGSGNDLLVGGAADDTVFGGDDDDFIMGSLGVDAEYGESGNDVLDEGPHPNGGDLLSGGGGVDVVRYTSRVTAVTVTVGSRPNDGAPTESDDVQDDVEVVEGSAHDDTLSCASTNTCTLRGASGDDTLTGNVGADTLEGEDGDDLIDPGLGSDVVRGGPGQDTISYGSRTNSVAIVLGTSGHMTMENGEPLENDSLVGLEHLIGGSGDDMLSGNELDNRIRGGPGNDVLVGGAGNDVFDEGSSINGADRFVGGAGVDRVDYSRRTTALTVTIDGSPNDGAFSENDDLALDIEQVTGGSAGDTLTGSAAANVLDGMGGDDWLDGGPGDDVLSGGPGDDILFGGAGDDVLEDIADGGQCECGPGFDIAICQVPPATCEVR